MYTNPDGRSNRLYCNDNGCTQSQCISPNIRGNISRGRGFKSRRPDRKRAETQRFPPLIFYRKHHPGNMGEHCTTRRGFSGGSRRPGKHPNGGVRDQSNSPVSHRQSPHPPHPPHSPDSPATMRRRCPVSSSRSHAPAATGGFSRRHRP